METPQTNIPLGAAGIPRKVGEQPESKKGSIFGSLTSAVSKHPVAALALIIILVIIVIWQYATRRGWFGLGKKQNPPTRKEETTETDRLIDAINSGTSK